MTTGDPLIPARVRQRRIARSATQRKNRREAPIASDKDHLAMPLCNAAPVC
jgi:hypothetical protein